MQEYLKQAAAELGQAQQQNCSATKILQSERKLKKIDRKMKDFVERKLKEIIGQS